MNFAELSNNKTLLFVSHANPEDNEFARWLTVSLANEGYPVFCETANFLGGEDPWRDVEKIIRHNTVKFLFVQSRRAMEKDGTRRELNLAYQIARKENLKDFIIPLKIEDFEHYEVCAELQTTLSVEFFDGWAKGLHQLLKKLEQQKVERNSQFSAAMVNSWWRNAFSADAGVRDESEILLSNWYEMDRLPAKLYFHIFQPGIRALPPSTQKITFPHRVWGNGIISFAVADDLTDDTSLFGDKFTFQTSDLLDNKHAVGFLDEQTARDVITDLLRKAWENVFLELDLDSYELAAKYKFCYFRKDQLDKDKIHFRGVKNKTTWRTVVGYQTVGKNRRYWHFGVSGKPTLRKKLYFSINPHILFSDDGSNVWQDKMKIHKAKMKLTRNWWNAHWRDRILAVMDFLSNGQDGILLRMGAKPETHVWIDKNPLSFVSPVSFSDPSTVNSDEELADTADDLANLSEEEFDFDEEDEDSEDF